MTLTPATPKQLAYLRSLCEQAGTDIHAFLIEHGVTKLVGYPTTQVVADVPSKIMASRLIDELKGSNRRGGFVRDPGEDMADRWSESHS